MANTYSGAIFDIDTATDLDGLTTLKGGAPAKTDSCYVHGGATLTLSASLEMAILKAGIDFSNVSSTGYIDVLAGTNLGFATGAGKGLFVDSLGQFVITGTSGSRCAISRASGESGYYEMPDGIYGIFQATECQIDYVDLIGAIAGQFSLDNSTMVCLFSATNELICSGTMDLASSVITSEGNRWALLNYGEVTLDPNSYLENVRLAFVCSTHSLVFDDDPWDLNEDNPIKITNNIALGGVRSRGKRLAMMGRRLLIKGSFQTVSGGTNRYESHYLQLKKIIYNNDTYKVTWDEGSINKALISKFPIIRTPFDIQERPFSIEVKEIY